MVRKSYSEENILRLLREIKVHLSGGMDVISEYSAVGVFLSYD